VHHAFTLTPVGAVGGSIRRSGSEFAPIVIHSRGIQRFNLTLDQLQSSARRCACSVRQCNSAISCRTRHIAKSLARAAGGTDEVDDHLERFIAMRRDDGDCPHRLHRALIAFRNSG
jgi:hypothetical protein